MKKIMYYVFILHITILYPIMLAGCDSDDISADNNGNNNEEIVEGPSSDDVLAVPVGVSFWGDSIRFMESFSLSEHKIRKVTVSTTLNGYISVLGGYKEQSAVYIYAKVEDDDKNENLSDEQIKNILEKYYIVESYVSDTEIVAKIDEKNGIEHESDFRNLRISVKIFTPRNVSTDLNIARGSIVVNNVKGNRHTAKSNSGVIKYIDSYGGDFTVNSETGHIGFINTNASQSINAKLTKGNILLALPGYTKASLQLSSSTKVNAYILNSTNFSGINVRTNVEGKLNGGGYIINANSGLGVINLRWYEKNSDY